MHLYQLLFLMQSYAILRALMYVEKGTRDAGNLLICVCFCVLSGPICRGVFFQTIYRIQIMAGSSFIRQVASAIASDTNSKPQPELGKRVLRELLQVREIK